MVGDTEVWLRGNKTPGSPPWTSTLPHPLKFTETARFKLRLDALVFSCSSGLRWLDACLGEMSWSKWQVATRGDLPNSKLCSGRRYEELHHRLLSNVMDEQIMTSEYMECLYFPKEPSKHPMLPPKNDDFGVATVGGTPSRGNQQPQRPSGQGHGDPSRL